MRRILAVRDVRIFFAGWTVSVFGDWAMFIVLGVWTKALTGSNAAAGLVFFALSLPSLFSPLAQVGNPGEPGTPAPPNARASVAHA